MCLRRSVASPLFLCAFSLLAGRMSASFSALRWATSTVISSRVMACSMRKSALSSTGRAHGIQTPGQPDNLPLPQRVCHPVREHDQRFMPAHKPPLPVIPATKMPCTPARSWCSTSVSKCAVSSVPSSFSGVSNAGTTPYKRLSAMDVLDRVRQHATEDAHVLCNGHPLHTASHQFFAGSLRGAGTGTAEFAVLGSQLCYAALNFYG